MARHAKTPGAVVSVPRRQFDLEQRAAAEDVDAAEQGWLVSYSLSQRQYLAFPCWRGAPTGLVVLHATTAGLTAGMRHAEAEAAANTSTASWR
jgi:hypothetical protein